MAIPVSNIAQSRLRSPQQPSSIINEPWSLNRWLTTGVSCTHQWWGQVRKDGRFWFSIMLCFGAVTLAAFLQDKQWVQLTAANSDRLRFWAQQCSWWGDLGPTCLGIPALLAGLGWLTRSPQFYRTAKIAVLAALCAGLFTNIFRAGLGRPRPVTGLPDGLYGPSLDWKYHGSPSGHATAAAATAWAIAGLHPGLGVPLVAWSGAVAWSRVALERHHWSDVLLGHFIGLFFGLSLARNTRHRTPTSDAPRIKEA